jgi:hypothetical protein
MRQFARLIMLEIRIVANEILGLLPTFWIESGRAVEK